MRFKPAFFMLFLMAINFRVPSRLFASPQDEYALALRRNEQTIWVRRALPEVAQQPESDVANAMLRLRAVITDTLNPTGLEEEDSGFAGLFPPGTILDELVPADDCLEVRMTIPGIFLEEEMDGFLHDEILRQVLRWRDAVPGIAPLEIMVRPDSYSRWKVPFEYLRFSPVASKPGDGEEPPCAPTSEAEFPHPGQPQPAGALSGASIFLAPGHGWYYSGTAWITQRQWSYEIIEDHLNAEMVLQYLAGYLWNAGARVYTCRERDMNPNMVIVDNGGTGYSETGAWETETDTAEITGAYGGALRKAVTVTGALTATATFTPNVPEEGFYAVYVWYRAVESSTTTDAQIHINHTGGASTWIQNQNHDGYTWKYLGTYHFNKGANPDAGSVTITNQSATAGNYVIADAIRLGGGMGEYVPSGATTSGRPRYEEAGIYHAGFMGYTYNLGRTESMPKYAGWEHETWEAGTGAYFSLHNNAAGGTGTETYYSTSGVAGSKELADAVHAEVMKDVRAGWYSGWANRGVKTANFTEIISDSQNEMPAALIEIGFFDRPDRDVYYLKEAEFHNICARAIFQGMVTFYTSYYSTRFTNKTLLPEPPIHFTARNNPASGVRLTWDAPPSNTGNGYLGDPATRYKVYRSRNGKGFDNGVETIQNSLVLEEGFLPGEVWHFRVTALNAGGESFPTEVLSVRIHEGIPPVLIVNGFSRLDRGQNVMERDRQSGKDASRVLLWKMNSRDYSLPHATALAAAGYDFDSASLKAVTAGRVSLGEYKAVVWIGGAQGGLNPIVDVAYDLPSLDAASRTLLGEYLDGGGKLFISGAEISQDLGGASPRDAAFLSGRLRAAHLLDSAGIFNASGAPGSIFEGLSLDFDDGTGRSYRVGSPDVLLPANGSMAALISSVSSDPIILEDFDDLTGWWDPNSSGQTNADNATEGVVDTTTKFEGTASGRLRYVWGSGNHIRWYNPARPAMPATSIFSVQVHGDSSGHQMRISLRDSDNEIFANDWMTIDWTGWRDVRFNISADNKSFWYAPGDGALTGPSVGFDSLELRKIGAQDTGDIHFDIARALPPQEGGGQVMAVQYGTPGSLVFMTIPFETIAAENDRNDLIARIFDFFFPEQSMSVWALY